jgi:mycofactocin precursor
MATPWGTGASVGSGARTRETAIGAVFHAATSRASKAGRIRGNAKEATVASENPTTEEVETTEVLVEEVLVEEVSIDGLCGVY